MYGAASEIDTELCCVACLSRSGQNYHTHSDRTLSVPLRARHKPQVNLESGLYYAVGLTARATVLRAPHHNVRVSAL